VSTEPRWFVLRTLIAAAIACVSCSQPDGTAPQVLAASSAAGVDSLHRCLAGRADADKLVRESNWLIWQQPGWAYLCFVSGPLATTEDDWIIVATYAYLEGSGTAPTMSANSMKATSRDEVSVMATNSQGVEVFNSRLRPKIGKDWGHIRQEGDIEVIGADLFVTR